MKKFFALITACMLVLSCFSCDEKKQEDNSSEVISETIESTDTTEIITESPDTGNTVVESGFRELSVDDFRTINVSITYPDKEAPVTMTRYELPEYDFGERLAPCKKTEDPTKYDPLNIGNGSSYNKDQSNYMDKIDTPEEGIVIKAFKRGNKIYMIVNYDKYCIYCHEWALFCYDIDTKETKEIYTFSDTEYFSYDEYTCMLENKLVVCRYRDFGSDRVPIETKIDAIDLESGEAEEIYSTSNSLAVISSNGTDAVQIAVMKQTETEARYHIMEYNTETGEMRDTGNSSLGLPMGNLYMFYSGTYLENNYKEGCQIVTNNYKISTGINTTDIFSGESFENIRSAEIIYASENKAILQEYNMIPVIDDDMTPDRKIIIHTYDLEKMEHYVTEINEKMYGLASYNGDIIMCDYQMDYADNIYYMRPELGLAFKVTDSIEVGHVFRHGNSLEINEVIYSKSNISNYNEYSYGNVPALWIMEDKK